MSSSFIRQLSIGRMATTKHPTLSASCRHYSFLLFSCLLLCEIFSLTTGQYLLRERRKNDLLNGGGNSNSKSQITSYESKEMNIASNVTELTLLVMMSEQRELPIWFELLKPTVEIAAEDINQKYPDFQIRIKSIRDPRSCEENVLGAMAAQEYYNGQVNGIIGPICNRALNVVSRLANYWQIPVITAGGVGLEFSNKHIYKTLTRISFSVDRVAHFFSKVVQDYDWHHFAFIIDESDPLSLGIRYSMEKHFKELPDYETTLDFQEFNPKAMETSDAYNRFLIQAKKVSRVFIFVTNGDVVRNFLVNAYDLGMNNGEYAFFGIELLRQQGSTNNFKWYRPADRSNKKAKLMFESLMTLAVRIPISEEYTLLESKISTRAAEEFGHLNQTFNPLIAGFYDTVMLYAYAFNRSLFMTADQMTQAEKFREILWNNIFPNGKTGDIVLNENGDREVDYILQDFNPETGLMEGVLTYYGAKRIVEKNDGFEIQWPTGVAPLDVPFCGFNGEAKHCLHEEFLPLWAIVLLSMGIFSIVAFIVGFFIYKKVRAEQDLNSDWWIVDYKEIIFPSRGGQKSSLSNLTTSEDGLTSGKNSSLIQTRATTMMSTANSLMSAAGQFDSVLVGSYRGVKVAFKPLELRRINRTRKLLLELRHVLNIRDVQHENLVRFVGICVEDPNIAVVNELMIRGSLRDILDEGKMEIDWTFRHSMISDIIEGMIFIHSSDLQFHGRLKSTNCVIDGRFMVKITDYGLRSLHKLVAKESEINPRALFWTAPEHLREDDPVNAGSKAGDIFAFAIILQEIITRSPPYESPNQKNQLEPSEILDRVRMGVQPPFRPAIVSSDCPSSMMKVVQACWHEDPTSRPEFVKLKSIMRKISKGISSTNFLDNLLNRMEKYSESLQLIVEEKTQSIMEEKQRAEELLYQILPKYVANELKTGRIVKPELFEAVTIFFSDIVGFTTLSSLSSPLQVVNLLNDLYTSFDAIIMQFDVNKIETIGDAYMVASGVPIRNGSDHAREIALLALEMKSLVDKFKIRHLPKTKLKLRIGLHTGPATAGVVGTKMPKYLVFGDAVQLAAKMEATSEPMKIQVSDATKKILDTFKAFNLTSRGEMEIPDKGKITTWWLDGIKK